MVGIWAKVIAKFYRFLNSNRISAYCSALWLLRAFPFRSGCTHSLPDASGELKQCCHP